MLASQTSLRPIAGGNSPDLFEATGRAVGEETLAAMMRQQIKGEKRAKKKDPPSQYPIGQSIIDLMSDGRERTSDDMARQLKLPQKVLAEWLRALTQEGRLARTQIGRGINGYKIGEKK